MTDDAGLNGDADADQLRPVRSTKPALDVLDRDQDRILYDGDDRRDPPIRPLLDGFATYWGALSWYQAASVRTLGHLDRVLAPQNMLPEATLFEAVMVGTGDTSEGRYARVRLVEQLGDACDMAYRHFRERAVDRSDDGGGSPSWEGIDRENEKNPLMRPAFRQMDQQQAGALAALWSGFADRTEVSRWTRRLRSVSNGETPPRLMDHIVSTDPLLEALLDKQSRDAQLTRYRFAMLVACPAFLKAARTLRGGERSQTVGNDNPWNEVRD